MSRWWRALPPAAGAAALGAAVYMSGPRRMAAALANANPLLMAAAASAEAAAIALTGLAWHSIVRGMSFRPRPLDSVKATGLEVFVDATIPTGSVGGEILRITYAYNRMGIPIWNSVAAAVVLRVLIAGVLSSLLAAAALAGLARSSGMWILLAASIAAIAAVSALAVSPRRAAMLAPGRYRALAEAAIGPISSALRSWGAAAGLGFIAAEILSSAAAQMLVLHALDVRIPYYFVLAAYPIYDVLVALPTGIPGSFGVADVGTSLIYAALGVSWPKALASMVSTRVVCLIADSALGLPVFALEGRHLAPPRDLRALLAPPRG
ncbi:MAG: lysylphosphatidylglycerol synthase domain-containing protein [Conexivisphaera sp.]